MNGPGTALNSPRKINRSSWSIDEMGDSTDSAAAPLSTATEGEEKTGTRKPRCELAGCPDKIFGRYYYVRRRGIRNLAIFPAWSIGCRLHGDGCRHQPTTVSFDQS